VCKVHSTASNSQMDNGVFYGTINIAAVNALVIYAHNMRKDHPEKKIKSKDDCSELCMIWLYNL